MLIGIQTRPLKLTDHSRKSSLVSHPTIGLLKSLSSASEQDGANLEDWDAAG